MADKTKYIVSWIAWPGLFALCVAITAYGFHVHAPLLYFNFAYIAEIIALYFLERWMPHEKAWEASDGQVPADLAHTLSSKATVQLLVLFSTAIGLSEYLKPAAEHAYGIWPREWPMWAQAGMAVVIGEFPLYWAHRLGHEWPVIWRFHAIHHSVKKLWIVNTGRFHFVDSLIKIVVSMALLIALGAPEEAVQWLAAVTAFIGILTHCNIETRFGFLSWWFNTPELHRWHHSMDLREGNKNYCENVMVWDHVFGSYFRETHRRPPANIGIKEYMPPKFRHQLAWPFLTKGQRARIETAHVIVLENPLPEAAQQLEAAE